jgi:BirA family biotin operon repressor/biotin-[acetyl-CoA-carboxylase] ligase
MSGLRERLLGLLADGELHSGERLAASLAVSRTAVWKSAAELRQRGVDVASVDRRGYRLSRAVELLDPGRMRGEAAALGVCLPRDLLLLFEVDSTNDHLDALPPPPPGQPRLVFAELQRAGRGRRGRSWHAPFGSGLTFSLAWSFAETPADIAALSLAMGVQVAQALRGLGAREVRLKWPNDLVHDFHKVGGLLAQLRTEAGGPAHLVLGLGLNLQLDAAQRQALAAPGALPAGDLADAFSAPVGRNRIAAAVAAALLDGLRRFEAGGFAPFAADWAELDALHGRRVRIEHGTTAVEGVALGAAADGALRLAIGERVERFHSGDLRLRPADPT